MVKLIVGNKGSGKTKRLIDMANHAVKTTNGNVVCVEKGLKLTYDLDYAVRLVDIENYNIHSYDSLYGFLAGLFAGNYDITEVFVDATFKIAGKNPVEFAALVEKVAGLIADNGANITFTVSCDSSELPEGMHQYMI